jgi:chromosome segregation ATPase
MYVRAVRLHDRLLARLRGENKRVGELEDLLRRAEDNSSANFKDMRRAEKELEKNRLALESTKNNLSVSNDLLENTKGKEERLRNELVQALQRHRTIKEQLKEQLAGVLRASDSLQRTLIEKTEKIKTLESEVVDVIRSRGSRVASAVAEADEHIKRLSKALKDAAKTEEEYKKKLDAANKSVLDNETKLKKLEAEKETLLKDTGESKGLAIKKQKTIDHLNLRIGILEKTAGIAQEAAEKARGKTIAAESRVENLVGAVRAAKAARDGSELNASLLESTLRVTGQQLADAIQKAESLKTTVDKLEYEQDKLNRTIASRTEAIGESIRHNDAMNNTVAALRAQLTAERALAQQAPKRPFVAKRRLEGYDGGLPKRPRI